MRNIGINVRSNIVYGAGAFIECIAAKGFNSTFTFGNDEKLIELTSKKCQQTRLFYESLHAPFSNINDIWLEGSNGSKMLDDFLLSVNLAHSYNIPIVVCHLSSGAKTVPVSDAGLRRFDTLINEAAKKNVTIAFENQRKLANLAMMFELYGKDTNVGFCWDVGHEKCFANSMEYMPLFGDRLVFTHIHDNFEKPDEDEHLLPFDGSINYSRTAELLKKYDYKGTLMLEIDEPHEGSPKYSDLSMEKFTDKAYKAICRLRDMIDN
ncbi:MAG: sugar phosphate isomerase/epimerase [Clostridia bacterium]|nr:sugar phosphate isomerase/epimerase [Clostridia bacterium]